MSALSRARDRMVAVQIERRGVRDRHVLEAMREVPREAFVEPGFEEFAYEDTPLRIGEGQTISQPYIVALMIETAEVTPGDRVLEIGAGSGYAAAVLSRIAGRVHAIERHASLAEAARQRFRKLGYEVELRVGDGTLGWPEAAPFDAIVVSAGGPAVPEALERQLAVGGRLVIPVGAEEGRQTLLKLTRKADGSFDKEERGSVIFVPLIGEQGWAEDGRRAATSHVPARSRTLPEMIAEAAEPLPEPDDPASAGCSTASPTGAWSCSGRRATAPPSSTALVQRSRAISSSSTALPSWRSKPTGPTRRPSTPMCAIVRPRRMPSRRSSAFRPGCGATPRSRPSSRGCAATMRPSRSPLGASAFTASTSTTWAARSRPCWSISTGSTPRRPASRASATAA
ncbi:MAG: protein-L-isoaspartate(D-aspartate) O-methyltransferase [Enhydrobacter sp.]|nr:protein-L-isoaspartate(D-aspartate) O-methyltransferase [Enhydrobacter sp.]